MIRVIQNINSKKIKLSTIKGFNLVNLIYQNGSKVHSDNISIVYISMDKLGKIYNFELSNRYKKNQIEYLSVVQQEPQEESPLTNLNNEDITTHLYYGTISSKKNNKKAACRNRIKRLLREGLAELLKNKDNYVIYNDLFILMTSRHKIKKQSELNLADVLQDFKVLFDKLDKKLKNQLLTNNK